MRNHIPVIATEIEFYLFGSEGRDLTEFWVEVRKACEQSGIAVFNMEKERGREQHEVSLAPTRDIPRIITDTERLKTILGEVATAHKMRADFSAKPVADDHGNGLHVHVHLEDAQVKNLYSKKDEAMSDALAHSIAGLLATMQDNMSVFAPTAESRKRFVAGGNAPTTLSWGANNRTCAIRLPDKPWDHKHIEHRVSGADADVAAVINAILAGIDHGITNKLTPPPQIYGDASLPIYGLPQLFSI